MVKIYIEPANGQRVVTSQGELAVKLRDLATKTDSIRSNLRWEVAGKQQISRRLRDLSEQITQESDRVVGMKSALTEVLQRYEQAESGNLNQIGANSMESGGVLGGGGSGGGGGGGSRDPKNWLERLKENLFGNLRDLIVPVVPQPIGSILGYILNPEHWFRTEGGNPEWKGSSDLIDLLKNRDPERDGSNLFNKIDDFNDRHTTWEQGTPYYLDPKTGKKTYVDKNNKDAMNEFKEHNKPVDVRFLGVGTEGSISIFGDEGTFTGKYGGVEGSYDFGKLEGTASGYIGTMGIGAALGVSFTAFTASEMAYLGSENTNVYEKLTITAGKVSADGKVNVGVFDKDGSFNPSAYASASAEAIAGEITGKVGVKALGTDVGVEGSLNYGIGTHANIGINDGKVSVDIGATLGVGASLKVEIDVSGTVKAVSEKASEVWSGVKNLFGW